MKKSIIFISTNGCLQIALVNTRHRCSLKRNSRDVSVYILHFPVAACQHIISRKANKETFYQIRITGFAGSRGISSKEKIVMRQSAKLLMPELKFDWPLLVYIPWENRK